MSSIDDIRRRIKRTSELRLAVRLAEQGYVKSARALVRRAVDRDEVVPVIEINRTTKDR